MTVKADITSTLNGQTAELLLVEDSPDGTRKQQSRSLSGGTEELVFTSLDGGRDKRYTAKVIPSTTDVTQTSEIQFGAEIRIDPIPHRDSDATQKIRDGVEFNNGVAASQLGLGSSPLVSGLLTAALNDGEVLADDGSVHESVQAAQDAASSYIFIGPGTFNESVTIDTPGLTVQGSGFNSHIDGGTIGTAIDVTVDNVTITNLSVSTTGGQGNAFNGIYVTSGGNNFTLANVTVRDSDSIGVRHSAGTDSLCHNVTVKRSDSHGFFIGTVRGKITNCSVLGGGTATNAGAIIISQDDGIIANCVVDGYQKDGIGTGGSGDSDLIVIGNRVIGVGQDGITTNGADIIVANNRVSDSGGSDLSLSASTLTDANNTGPAN